MAEANYVTYTGGGAWRTRAFDGLSFARGETKDVGSEEAADWLVSNHAFEHADAPEDDEGDAAPPDTSAESEDEAPPEPLDGTVSELEDELATGEYDDELVDLYNAEKDHDDRTTAIEAIQSRRDELREENSDGSDSE